jgi:hypothetical protein
MSSIYGKLSKFLGGLPKQSVYAKLDPKVHTELHKEVGYELKKAGLPLRPNTEAAVAAEYFQRNPGAQEKAFEAVRRASETIDRKHGTNVSEVFKTVLDQKEFRAF